MNQNPKPAIPWTTLSRQNLKLTVPFWRQLWWHLILAFVLVAVLPMVVVVFITLARSAEQAREQVANRLISIAGLKQDQIERWLENSSFILDLFLADTGKKNTLIAFTAATLSNGDSLDTVRQNAINNSLRDAVKAQASFEEMFLYNTDGRVIAASDPVQIGKLLHRRPYFAASLEREVVEPPHYESGVKGITMVMTRPLIDPNGQTVGALAGRLNMSALGQIMTRRTGLGKTGETYLISLESNYLVTPSRFADQGYSMTRAYFSQGIERVLNGEDGSGIYGDYRDPPVPVIGVYRWIPDLQVGLLAEVDEAEALVSFATTRNFSLGVALLAAVAAILAGLYSAARVARPVAELTQTADQIASGDLSRRAKVSGLYEIGLLATTFNDMAARLNELIDDLEQRLVQLRQTKQNLQKSEGRYSSLINDVLGSSTVGIFILNAKFEVVWINHAVECYFGLRRQKIIGQDKRQFIQTQIKHVFADPEYFAEKILATYKDNTYIENFECHILPTDEHPEYWLEHHSQPIQTGLYAGGRIEHYYDITERKQAQEQIKASLQEKEVLLKEIHHRVKNNLQVVSSLLDLQSGYIEDKQARHMFKESQIRIKSMALIHEQLYQTKDLAKIDFAEYVQSLTNYLFRSHGARGVSLRSDIAPVSLSIETAIPCGLIINELVSNAMKYAFPPATDQAGEIRIELQATEGRQPAGGRQLTLLVKDNGVGFPPEMDFRHTKSLGLKLVMTLVKQIEGTIELQNEDGTAFKITFTDLRDKSR